MDKVIGDIAGVPNPKSDWGQNDKRKADYIKNKPDLTVFANALKGTISGEAIGITDISPIEHNMGVSVRCKQMIPPQKSTVTVQGYTYDSTNGDGSFIINTVGDGSITSSKEVLGKNLHDLLVDGKTYTFAMDNFDKKPVAFVLATTRLSDNKAIYHVASSSNNFIQRFTVDKSAYRYDRMYLQINTTSEVFENVIVKPILALGSYTSLPFAPYIEDISTVKLYKQGKKLLSNDVYEKSNWIYNAHGQNYTYNFQLSKGIYTISFDCVQQKGYFYLQYSTDNWETSTSIYLMTPKDLKQPHTFEADGKQQWRLYWYSNSGWFADGYITNIQIEVGSSYTGYEEYIEPTIYDVQADGIVESVKSLYPSTTLYTDTSGAVIDCTYNRDINKAFAELQNAIIAIGGLE